MAEVNTGFCDILHHLPRAPYPLRPKRESCSHKVAQLNQLPPSKTVAHPTLSADERRRAARELLWFDHGVLRTFWTNFGEVAPEVYRSNHPTEARLAAYRDRGIKAVLSLRGKPRKGFQKLEIELCKDLGLAFQSVALQARLAAKTDNLLALFAAFDNLPRPFVMHCKSGADRAGLASALYKLDQGANIEDARKELSLRYLHLKFSKTGVQDHMLDVYEARLAQGPISIRDWIANEYDQQAVQASFDKKRILPI